MIRKICKNITYAGPRGQQYEHNMKTLWSYIIFILFAHVLHICGAMGPRFGALGQKMRSRAGPALHYRAQGPNMRIYGPTKVQKMCKQYAHNMIP